MAISDLIKVTKSKIKQYYDSQNVMQCRCRLHSCNHGKIVKTSTKTKKTRIGVFAQGQILCISPNGL